ncbi:MAG: PQQ-binding-like beta-propeller repeat protein [Pseudomonadota bacterium]
MKFKKTPILPQLGVAGALLLAAALAACGGGGGGSGSSANNGGWLTFSPATAEVTVYEGETESFNITATASKTLSDGFYVAIIDPSGVIAPTFTLTPVSQLQYTVGLETADKLTPGVHVTLLEVRLCKDAAAVCKQPIEGSPWHVPLTVNVKTKAEGAARVTILPAAIELKAYPNEAPQFTIDAKFSGGLDPSTVSIGLKDPSGLLININSSTSANALHYDMQANSMAGAGTRSGFLELHICKDYYGNCLYPVAGSPWRIPVNMTVGWTANLSTLQSIDGLSAWSTFQGNAAHTSYVPLSVDPSKIARRWSSPGEEHFSSADYSVVSDNGMLFVLRGARHFERGELVAIHENTGSVAWRADLGTAVSSIAPAAANGHVYVMTNGFNGVGALWSFDQMTGALLAKTAGGGYDTGTYLAPTVYGDNLYFGLGPLWGNIAKFSSDLSLAWSVSASNRDHWTPAVDASAAYFYGNGSLHAQNNTDGSTAYLIPAQDTTQSYGESSTVVLSGQQMAYTMANRELLAFNLATRTRAWSHPVVTGQQPAYAKGVVYVMNLNVLEAYDAKTGALLWATDRLPDYAYGRLVITDTLAFVGSTGITVAIDLQTRKTVWSYPASGDLSISKQGVLYIYGEHGEIAAFNLR